MSCKETSSDEITTVAYTSDRGEFSYTILGDVDVNKQGSSDFYRAGNHVIILFGSRTAFQRLELAYEETRANHVGVFPVVQQKDPGGFLMFYKYNEEEYWQREGTIEITVSNEDTIIGRMDHVILGHAVDGYADSMKMIEVTGRFEAY